MPYRYRISLSSRWKQRGMYATCMWTVQLLLVLSKVDLLFTYVPEYYLEALVNQMFCFIQTTVLHTQGVPFIKLFNHFFDYEHLYLPLFLSHVIRTNVHLYSHLKNNLSSIYFIQCFFGDNVCTLLKYSRSISGRHSSSRITLGCYCSVKF